MERGNGKLKKKKGAKEKVYEQLFGRRMNGKQFENMSEMNNMMAEEGFEMKKEENWYEDRRWMTIDVRASINGRKEKHLVYRNTRRLYGVNDEKTQMANMRYL